MITEKKFLDLLDLSFEVIQSLDGKPSSDYRIPDCQQIATKLYFHASSIYWLTKGTKAPVPKSRKGTSFIDFASIAVLTRAIFETYLSLFEVFLEEQSEDEFEFNHALWQLAGFSIREGIQPAQPEFQDAYFQAQTDNENIRDRIKRTEKFQSLNRKQQKLVLDGKRIRGRIQVAEAAGFGKQVIRQIYKYYSGYVHSDGLSASQIFEAETSSEQAQSTHLHLIVTSIVLSKLIVSYYEKYEEARSVCMKHQPVFLDAKAWAEVMAMIP